MSTLWFSKLRCVAAAFVALSLSACGPDFAPSYLVQEARVIAIVADPPEAVPGQQVRLTPLVVSSRGTLTATSASSDGDYDATWWRCPDAEGDFLQDATICEVPSDREELSQATPYVDTIPLDLFPIPLAGEELSVEARQRLVGIALGYWRVIGLEAVASPVRREQAIKRVVVYSPVPLAVFDPALAPLDTRVDDDGNIVRNENPSVTGVEVREDRVDGPSVTTLTPGETYFFKPRYNENSLSPYISLRADLADLPLDDLDAVSRLSLEALQARFERVERCEIPLFSWYVTAGTLRRETTVDEQVIERFYTPAGISCPPVDGEARSAAVRYLPPEGDAIPDDGIVHAWVVMRDGRGGTSTREFDFVVER